MTDIYVTYPPKKQDISFEWRTSIVNSELKGNELRSIIYRWPRLSFDLEYDLVTAEMSAFFKRNLFHYTEQTFWIPIWHDSTEVSSLASSGQNTVNVLSAFDRNFYEGREIIIINPDNFDDYEICIIETISTSGDSFTLLSYLQNSWDAGSLVMPLYPCKIPQDNEIEKPIPHYGKINLTAYESFEETRDFDYEIPASNADTYLDLDIFNFSPSDFKYEISRYYEEVKFFGLGYSKTDLNIDDTKQKFNFTIFLKSKAEIFEFLDFYNSKRGRFGTFWFPSYENDIAVNAAVLATDTELSVEDFNLALWADNDVVGKYIYILFPDKTYTCRTIESVATAGDSITIDSAIGQDVSAADLKDLKIYFMNYCRFGGDEIKIEYIRPGNAAKINVSIESLVNEDIDDPLVSYPIEIYKIWRGEGSEETAYFYTSGDVSIEYNYETYLPAAIMHDAVQFESDLDAVKTTVTAAAITTPLAAYLAGGMIETYWMDVSLLYTDESPYATKDIVIIGRIKDIVKKGAKVSADVVGLEENLNQEIPYQRFAYTCLHTLYDLTIDLDCQQRTSCNLNKDDYKRTATLSEISDDGLTLTSSDFADSGVLDLQYGFIEFTDNNGFVHTRMITSHIDEQIEIRYAINDLSLESSGGAEIFFYPGCDHTIETCRDKFDNVINFLGFPYVPNDNPCLRS